MKRLIRRILPQPLVALGRSLKGQLPDAYAFKSYSQEGEDMILRRLFEGQVRGFYVDVGAHHPSRFSNTYFFYKLGWSGINIDATPGSMVLFRKWRPRDINVEAAIGRERRALILHIFNDPALNTFDRELAQSRSRGVYRVVHEQKLYTRPLVEVLAECPPPRDRRIDFMTVDVEGMDLEVLQSNDWGRFRPAYVLVECFGLKPAEFEQTAIYQFMTAQGYHFFAKTANTVFFESDAHD